MESLPRLAKLLQQRNLLDLEIGAILGRPVLSGHFGEYVAAPIFGIKLHSSATYKGSDGLFIDGPLAGRSVNIKYYPKRSDSLDLTASSNTDQHPDYYLVLAGPKSPAMSSKGTNAPWNIAYVYFFSSHELVPLLTERGVKIGTATSIRGHLWEAAEIYPECPNPAAPLILSGNQREALELFAPAASPL